MSGRDLRPAVPHGKPGATHVHPMTRIGSAATSYDPSTASLPRASHPPLLQCWQHRGDLLHIQIGHDPRIQGALNHDTERPVLDLLERPLQRIVDNGGGSQLWFLTANLL